METITLGDGAILGGFVALAMILYRLVDYLLNKRWHLDSMSKPDCDERCIKDGNEVHDASKKIIDVDLKKLASQVDQLHAWHNKTDRDGVPVWYVRSSLEDAINRLVSAIEVQTKLLERLETRQELETQFEDKKKK